MAAGPRGSIFARGRGDDRAGEPAAIETSTEVSSSAIERLRSSLARPDRKTPETASAEDASYAPPSVPAPPATAGPAFGTNGASAPPASAAETTKKKPPLDFLFRSKSRQQSEPFDDVWPKRGGRQAEDAGESARQGAGEAPKPSDKPAGEEARSTAILKSGVVDGMAYTLYVDGSIEAQLPQGTVRFGSIAELRSHIENNS